MVGRMNDNYLTSAVVFAIALFLFGTALTLAAGMLTAAGLFPEFAGRCGERLRRPVRCFLVGAGVVVAAVAASRVGPWELHRGVRWLVLLPPPSLPLFFS